MSMGCVRLEDCSEHWEVPAEYSFD